MALAKAPIDLILQQGPMLQSIGRIGMQSALPFRRKRSNPESYDSISLTVAAPSRKLIEHFLFWSGADSTEPEFVPPHLFPQWTLPVASRLAEQTRYPLSRGLNQGCDLQINGPLPIDQELQVRGEMVSVKEQNGKARIHTRVTTSTRLHADALVADSIIVVPLGRRIKKQESSEDAPAPTFETVGTWHCAPQDGLDFAILTGDFNPIHWLTPVARISPFKGRILHGFGSFVRSFEVLARDAEISGFSARFTRPVPIPSGKLQVQRETGGGKTRAWKLTGEGGVLHAAGSYTCR